jgi:hypothetical protein
LAKTAQVLFLKAIFSSYHDGITWWLSKLKNRASLLHSYSFRNRENYYSLKGKEEEL